MLNNILSKGAAFTLENEGFSFTVYTCPAGYPTIGVGYNLTRPDAKKTVQGMGYDYEDVLSGKQQMSGYHILALYDATYKEAMDIVDDLVDNVDILPYNVLIALNDMAFNMGKPRLSQFKKMLAAVDYGKFEQAAVEAKDSRWYKQVGNRGPKVCSLFKSWRD